MTGYFTKILNQSNQQNTHDRCVYKPDKEDESLVFTRSKNAPLRKTVLQMLHCRQAQPRAADTQARRTGRSAPKTKKCRSFNTPARRRRQGAKDSRLKKTSSVVISRSARRSPKTVNLSSLVGRPRNGGKPQWAVAAKELDLLDPSVFQIVQRTKRGNEVCGSNARPGECPVTAVGKFGHQMSCFREQANATDKADQARLGRYLIRRRKSTALHWAADSGLAKRCPVRPTNTSAQKALFESDSHYLACQKRRLEQQRQRRLFDSFLNRSKNRIFKSKSCVRRTRQIGRKRQNQRRRLNYFLPDFGKASAKVGRRAR